MTYVVGFSVKTVKTPVLQNHVTLVQTPVREKNYWGFNYHVGMPRADIKLLATLLASISSFS